MLYYYHEVIKHIKPSRKRKQLLRQLAFIQECELEGRKTVASIQRELLDAELADAGIDMISIALQQTTPLPKELISHLQKWV